MIDFTDKEKQFLINLLKQVGVTAMQPDALEVVTHVKVITEKLNGRSSSKKINSGVSN